MNNSEIQPENIWDKNKIENISKFIKEKSKKQSFLRIIKNNLLSLKYRIIDLFKIK